MEPLLFYGLAVLLLASGAAVVWLKNPVHAAYALIAAMLASAGLLAWLHAEFLALAVLLALAGGTSLLLMVGLPLLKRLGSLAESRPDEDRSFWGGIVAVIFFVITYRVLATTPWGLEDRSRVALTDVQRGLAAVRTLGEALRGEYALAMIAAALVVGVAVAVALALIPREADA